MTALGRNGVVLINYTRLGINKLSTFAHPIEVVATIGVGKYIIIALRGNPATGRDAFGRPATGHESR